MTNESGKSEDDSPLQIDLTQFLKHLSARYGESSADGSASFNWISMAREAGGIWRRVPRMSLLYVWKKGGTMDQVFLLLQEFTFVRVY